MLHDRISQNSDMLKCPTKMSGELLARRLPRTIDAHCHLHDSRLAGNLQAVLCRAMKANVSHVVSCACYEEDWQRLEELVSSPSSPIQKASFSGLGIVPSFGLHPWWADTASSSYLALLREKLHAYPRSVVGEIGLCKSTRGKQVDRGIQERVFQEQLQMATELERPCVIHCVGAYGKLLEILQSEKRTRGLPPVVVLHSYSGAADMVSAFLKLQQPRKGSTRVFFSLNAKQFVHAADTTESKVGVLCRSVPVESLLLETDAPDQVPPLDGCDAVEDTATIADSGLNEPTLVQLALSKAAFVRQVDVEELASIVYANSIEAFRISVNE